MIPENDFANELAEAYYRLAKAYCETGEGEAAEAALRALIEGGNASLGIGHARERRFYRRVLRLYQENYQRNLPEAGSVREKYVKWQLNYGNMLSARGRDGEARASYESALDVKGIDAEKKAAIMDAVSKLERPVEERLFPE